MQPVVQEQLPDTVPCPFALLPAFINVPASNTHTQHLARDFIKSIATWPILFHTWLHLARAGGSARARRRAGVTGICVWIGSLTPFVMCAESPRTVFAELGRLEQEWTVTQLLLEATFYCLRPGTFDQQTMQETKEFAFLCPFRSSPP